MLRTRTVVTRAISDPGPLAAYLPADSPTCHWTRRGEGMVGIGEALRFETKSITEADAWWAEQVADLDHSSDAPGASPVVFGSFEFDPQTSSVGSVLVVPKLVIGRRNGAGWITSWDEEPTLPALAEVMPRSGPISWEDGSLSATEWAEAVSSAVDLIRSGLLEKVVLARDVVARADRPYVISRLLDQLAKRYPSTWAFHVDGLVGATPELLVRRERGLATSRVLAGTIHRQAGDTDGAALALALAASSKDLAEHEYAVASVAESLAPYCSGMNVPEEPYVLPLPNLMHLASDVTGVCLPGASSLAMAGGLHPTAAVCGTPTEAALAAIRSLERLDRGRYAGPVGWMDATGDGEWGIALRCAHVSGAVAHAYAGCGIVEGSVPSDEVAETQAKLIPMREALRGF